MRFIPLTAFITAFSFAAALQARQIQSWPYERLFKEADLIVIASAQETVQTDQLVAGERWKSALIGQKTTFTVQSVLKGRVGDTPLAVHHFKLKDGIATQDGPMLIAFRTKSITINGGGSAKYEVELGTPHYLLFLKADGKGRFEPLSGQIDPELSVKEIYEPLPAVMDQK